MAQPQHVPYVQIIEQPASKALRFRYECEGRSAGSIPGVTSTSENKTYPTIKIFNYVGPVVIVVSCVTKDEPYRPHPHNLVGRERCDRGVCTIPTRITEESTEYQFKNLGIQCVKRRDIAEALRVRQGLRVDPFRTGFSHMEHAQSIDLNAVRLCFQVFLPDAATGRCRRPLTPVVSDIIYDKKAMSDLLIMRASHCSGPIRGGTQVILLCEKVTREDTVVVFYLEENNVVIWEETANMILVHKQVAIAFETPPFKDPNPGENVTVHFQLKRVTDNARSNSLPFEYICDYPDMRYKRKKVANLLQTYDTERSLYQLDQKIKSEPRDKTPPYLPQYGEQQWAIGDNVAGAIAMPVTSNNPFAQEMWPSYVHPAVSPGAQPLSPPMHLGQTLQVLTSAVPSNLQPMSPHMPMSPTMQGMSPHRTVMSPQGHIMSPHGQATSPGMQGMSPHRQMMSPHGQATSPGLQVMPPEHIGRISPHHPQNLGHISPNLVQQQQVQQQQVQQIQPPNYQQVHQQLMDTDNHSTSFSNLLLDRGEGIMLNSGELSGLSSLLGD